MNFIQQIVESYGGDYWEDPLKKIHAPSGLISYQPKGGLIKVNDSQIKIVFEESGGAIGTIEPIRIILKLENDFKNSLNIYPRTYLNCLTDLIAQPKSLHLPNQVKKQFSFRGDKGLIKKIAADNLFCKSILDEFIYISLFKSKPKSLILTPAHGLESINHFNKLITVLMSIEEKIKETALNTT